jgi:SpoVK/Ycf46/Vps4 family AAA+-type ATPase
VKAVFGLARRLSPCVVFLDEVDALFGARSARGGGFGNKAHDQLLTEFMQEMDGLSSAGANRDKRVVVIGATNRPFDLDDAVLRRLPRRLLVDLPGPEDRIGGFIPLSKSSKRLIGAAAILKILLRDEELGSDVDLDRIAKDTDGFSGSDLKRDSQFPSQVIWLNRADLCVSAALSAVKDMVEVPWRKARADAEAASSPIPAASSNTDVGAREDLVVLPQDTEVFRQEEAVPQPVTSALSGTSQNETEHAGDRFQIMAEDDDKRSSRPAAETGSQPQTSESAAGRSPSESTTSAESTEDETNDATSDETPNLGQRRILQFKHFEVALAEIRPSSSEEGSLPELRKVSLMMGTRSSLLTPSHSGPSNSAREARREGGRRGSAKVSASAK